MNVPENHVHSPTSLRRRLGRLYVFFVVITATEFSFVIASINHANENDAITAKDNTVQAAFLAAQTPRHEEAEATMMAADAQQSVARRDLVGAMKALSDAANNTARGDIVADFDAVGVQINRWRNGPPHQEEPAALKSAWQKLGDDVTAHISADLTEGQNAREVVKHIAGLAFLIGLVGAFIGVGFTIQSVLRPVKHLRALAEQLSSGQAITPVPHANKHRSPSAKELVEVGVALRAAAETMRQASAAKSAFIGNLSHELRTPLNAILGVTSSLQLDPEMDASQQMALTTIHDAGQHLLSVVNDVLDLARIEAGQITLSLESVALAEIVVAAGELVRPVASAAGVELAELIGPAGRVVADRRRAVQVLINLINNAVKYGGHGNTVEVTTSQHDDRWRISVTDHGPGIDAAARERLFHAFERGAAQDSEVEGTGLGLALSRRIVEAMGGEISVDSSPGAGCTFWFELPASNQVSLVAPVPDVSPELADVLRAD